MESVSTYIDHTNLRQDVTKSEIEKLCKRVYECGYEENFIKNNLN